MANPSLIPVSALYFLALVSLFYACAWILSTLTLFLLRRRVSHAAAKQINMAGLILPPLMAAVPTLAGLTLQHSHAMMLSEHHSAICLQMFGSIFSLGLQRGGRIGEIIAGVSLNSLAWLLLLRGLYLGARLLAVTIRLERGLIPYLLPPSPTLSRALSRAAVINRWKSRVYECPIPASCSSVLGLMNVRCVLSQEFVAAAEEDELDAVIAHEAAHIGMGDVRATFVVRALSCLYFFLWPARMLAHRWREEAELACDAAAIEATGKPLALAAAILSASGVPAPDRRNSKLPAAASGFADKDACSPARRVELLIARASRSELCSGAQTPACRLAGWITTLVLATVGVLLLMSSQTACYAHCSLEAVARFLP